MYIYHQSLLWDKQAPIIRLRLKLSPPSVAYMHQWIGSTLVQIMACRLFDAKPLSKPMLDYCQLALRKNFSETLVKNWTFSFRKMHLIMPSAKCRPFCPWEYELTLSLLAPDYSTEAKSIPCFLITWTLSSPGHQQPRYWLGLNRGVLVQNGESQQIVMFSVWGCDIRKVNTYLIFCGEIQRMKC